ncbi:uncharacterized protein G2W53_044634 [Senna tora]|uniref:Uncharacterized protein n=1 Tax=Senna tora TaxID=362788 RepID=A0A834W1K3_9FABA|nr:uncharacterized protein G2W53_044634 [Senna tora]
MLVDSLFEFDVKWKNRTRKRLRWGYIENPALYTIAFTTLNSTTLIICFYCSRRDPTDGMLWIQPCGQLFHPSVQPVRVIIKLITSKFEEPHHVYSQVPEKIKKLSFEEWAVNSKS